MECGERGELGECNIAGNVAKHSGECRQTFRGMLPNILRNFVPVAKHNGECRQTFRGMPSDSQECLCVCMYTLFTVGQKLSSIYMNNTKLIKTDPKIINF